MLPSTLQRLASFGRSSVEIGVRPKAELGDYKGLEVGRREPEVEPADVDAEIDRLREGFASLDPVEREAALVMRSLARRPSRAGDRGSPCSGVFRRF